MDKPVLSVQYICGDCAAKNNGKWPRGHVATMHYGRCDWCELDKALAHISDWDWPKNHPFHNQQRYREF